MNVAAWLGELGMGQYVQAFEDNDVDEQTLSLLTEADLADMGVASVSHRRRLAEAITALAGQPAAPAAAVAPARIDAEQRQLTVLAAPGQAVVDEQTRRLLEKSFALQPLDEHVLKGIALPVAAYAISGEHAADTRFDAHKGPDLAPMIGRDPELALLLERWALAQGREGQMVLLVGEAGIGKSRLTRAVSDACAGQPHWLVRWQCSPYHTGSALWPVVERLNRTAGVQAQDSTDTALDKLEALMGKHKEGKEATAVYAKLLGLDGTQRYGPLEMTPQMLRERTLELMVEQLLDMAEQRTLLLVVEDAHWIDPTTLELIERCLERIDSARMLILITSRPDNQPSLGAHPSVTRLSLNRLSRASVEAIVARLGGESLQAQTRAAIVAQTDGVPLFVEELTKAVLETGEAAIPASLHGSLMARLDRIPEVKEVAQIAACIGREFDLALVEAVAERPQAVRGAIDKLAAAELIFRRGDKANPRFTFKHALVQEAAHESLLRSKRQAIHARILEALEVEQLNTAPEILAHHAERARLADRAIGYWSEAGNAALAKSACLEAAAYLENAIRLIDAEPGGVDRRAREAALQLRLGQARIGTQGFPAQDTRQAFARALELFETDPGSASDRLQAQYGVWAWHTTRGEFDQGLLLANKALAAAQIGPDRAALLPAHRMVAASLFYLGDFVEAQEHLEPAVALVGSSVADEVTVRLGVGPRVATLCYGAWLLCLRGYAGQSRQMLARAHSLGAALEPSARAQMHMFSALIAASAGDGAATRGEAECLGELAAKHRLPMYGQYADAFLGLAAIGTPTEAAVRAYEQRVNDLIAARVLIWAPFLLARLAEGMQACGYHDEALRTIGRAFDECEATSQRWCEAELWRTRGKLLLHALQPDRAQATRAFERAMAIARDQDAKLWELRAAMSLARLWAGQGDRAKALDVLAPIHDWFTEGFDTVDLVEARVLLTELGT